MKPFALKCNFLLILVVYCLNIPHATGGKILWQKEYLAENGFSYSPGAAIYDSVDNKLLIMGTSFLPEADSEGKFMIWEVDLEGHLIKEEVIGGIPNHIKTEAHNASRIIKGLSISNSQRIMATGNFEGFSPSVMNMTHQGNNRTIKSIETGGINENAFILKSVYMPNDNCLLLGRDSSDNAVVLKTDSQGNKLWRQTYDNSQLEYFSDGIVLGEKGEFFVVGGSVAPEGPMSIGKDSYIWALKCDPQGNIVSEKIFPGDPFVRRMPQVCPLSSGRIIIVYNTSRPDSIAFKAFSSDLEEIWVKQSYEGRSVYDFKIKAVPEKGFVVAYGMDSTGLCVHEYNEDGDIKSKYSWEKEVRGGNFHLEVSADKAFIVLQTRAINENKINNLKIIALQLE